MSFLDMVSYIFQKRKIKNLYELWRKRESNLKYLKMWRGLVKVNILINKKRKIDKKNVNCIFVGYSLHNITYRI